MAYAEISDVEARMTRTLTAKEKEVSGVLLEDIAILIDKANSDAPEDIKELVSCRAVIRILGNGDDLGVPVGASQGSMSALGYAQSWTIGSGGASGELYLSKTEKKLLGVNDRIGSYSPVEGLVPEGEA